jgi:membrane peptidoglycan carboxypeptidase
VGSFGVPGDRTYDAPRSPAAPIRSNGYERGPNGAGYGTGAGYERVGNGGPAGAGHWSGLAGNGLDCGTTGLRSSSNASPADAGGLRRGSSNGNDRSGDGYDGAMGYGRSSNGSSNDRPNGAGYGRPDGSARRGTGRASQQRSRGGGDAPGAPAGWDGQQYGVGQGEGQSPTGLRDHRNQGGRTPGPGDPGENVDIKARLGAITGTAPAARPGIGGRAGLGHEYRGVLDAPRSDDSFDDVAGYRSPDTRSPTAAVRYRVDAARIAGTSRLPGRGEPGGHPRGAGGSGDGRDGGPPPRRKGSWWRHWTWKKALAVVGGLCATMMLLAIVLVIYAYSQTQIPTDVSEAALAQSSTVYFGNGKTVVGSFSTGTNRELLTSEQIPAVLKNAVIAAEDRSFYTEGGVSPAGILRAAYEDVSGGTFQGGSTITQQFVRQYYATIGTQQTVSRKMKEIFVAIKLSHEESKDWILTNYLNTVFLGNDAYGVGAAAQTYFNEPALELNVAQSAMLAAMINQPGFFSPDPHAGLAYAELVARWHYVLANMVRDGVITQQQADAQKFPKIHPGLLNNGWTGYRGYIMQAVEGELKNTYGYTQQEIDTRGLKIVTTFNEPMMNALYRAVNENKQQMKNGGAALPWYAHVGAVLEKPGAGAILAMYAGPGYNARNCAKLDCQLNMALESRNQVGSSFKPYVLATAVTQGMNVSTSVLDGYSSICSPSDQYPQMPSVTVSGTQCPTTPYGWYNFQSGEANGPVSVAAASALSLNTAYGDLIHRVGTQKVINMAKSFGVNTGKYPAGSNLQEMLGQSGIALGQASLTVEEQANTFAVLAADGQYATPHVIAQIDQGSTQIPLKIVHRQVLTPVQAADVDYGLSFDTVYGTAYPAAVLSPVRPTIAKTGTTNLAQSAFFIGAIPQYSLGIGIFTNSQSQSLNLLGGLSQGGYGGTWPAMIWHTFMQGEFGNLPVQPLPIPDYNGFAEWVQATAPKPQVQHHPNPGPSCGLRHPFGGPCPTPGRGGHPSPNPTPTPTQSCIPSPGHPCLSPSPPGLPAPGHAAATMQLAQPAEEPAVTGLRGG